MTLEKIKDPIRDKREKIGFRQDMTKKQEQKKQINKRLVSIGRRQNESKIKTIREEKS